MAHFAGFIKVAMAMSPARSTLICAVTWKFSSKWPRAVGFWDSGPRREPQRPAASRLVMLVTGRLRRRDWMAEGHARAICVSGQLRMVVALGGF